MIEMLKSGGILMIPIILCGLAATYIIIERCVYFSILRKNDSKLKANLKDVIERNDFATAESLCDAAGTPFAQVIKKAIQMRKLEERDLKDIVENEIEVVIPQLEHSLTLLGTIANISTLLGLFGTVTGNIKAFGVLGAGGTMGDPALLAGAIAEALVTTVAGLCVSIPSLIFNNFFISQVNHKIIEMQTIATQIIFKVLGKSKSL